MHDWWLHSPGLDWWLRSPGFRDEASLQHSTKTLGGGTVVIGVSGARPHEPVDSSLANGPSEW